LGQLTEPFGRSVESFYLNLLPSVQLFTLTGNQNPEEAEMTKGKKDKDCIRKL
jgi:hypothetical protein